MATSESAEIEAVKNQLEAILEEQGKQISELQQRMNQDSSHSKSFESQLTKEREMWAGKEKVFSSKVRQLEKELADLKDVIQYEAHPEKVLLSRLNKDVAQKEQLITGLKSSLGKERSRNKELEQQVLLLQQQHKQGITSTEKGKRKVKTESPKGNSAAHSINEEQIQSASTTPGEHEKLEVGKVETPDDDEQLEAISELFIHQLDSMKESGSSPYSKDNLSADYPECRCCHKILVDLVLLPCCHGYCIQCINDLKNEEDVLWCRICKEQIAIALQNCLKVSLEVKRSVRSLAMKNKGPCEYCKEQRKRDILESEFFCIQCRQTLCSECSSEHIRDSSCSTIHLLLDIRFPRSEVLEPEEHFCSKHPIEPLDFYCVSCKHLICKKCFTSHYDHSLLDTNSYSNAVKDKVKVILSEINGNIVYLTRMSDSFKAIQRNYSWRILRIRETIEENVDLMTYWLHKQATTLNRELDLIEKLSDDGIKSTQNDFEDCLSELRQFSLYAEEFIDAAEPNHMACFGEDLCKRATDLTEAANEKKLILENLGICKGERAIHPVNISFAPKKPKLHSNIRNLVGELQVKTVTGWASVKMNPKFVFPIKQSVVSNEEKEFAGLTTLGDELFVATRGNSSIEVYDKMTFEHKHFLSGMTNISDITACATTNCLYVYACKGAFKGIFKLDSVTGFDPEELLGMKYDAGRLSVTDECSIIVTGCNTNSLSEYTAEAKLSVELQLDPDTGILHLWHALKTGSGHFVVSHGVVSDAVQGVCLVDRDGTVLRSYGGNCRANLDIPMYLAFGERGCILVADLNNKRVLQLCAFLELKEELVSIKEGLKWPCSIHFDLISGKLFVANSTFLESWEVLVFDTK